mgnify:FL=1
MRLMKNVDAAEKYLGFLEEELDPRNIGYIDGFDFSVFMQKLLVSEYGYRKLGECEYWENTNYVCAYSLLNKIKKHPLLWKLFFMIA